MDSSSSQQDPVSDTQEPMKTKEADRSSKDGEQQQQQQKQEKAEQQQQQKQQQKQEMTVVDLSQYTHSQDPNSGVRSFALDEHQRNTADNPGRENTSTVPYLVRRVDSEELLPRPFKTTCQLVCVSYLASFCCVCLSAFAIKHAWQAKFKRNAGVMSRAVKEAKITCFYLKLALGLGIAFWSLGIILLSLFFTVGL